MGRVRHAPIRSYLTGPGTTSKPNRRGQILCKAEPQPASHLTGHTTTEPVYILSVICAGFSALSGPMPDHGTPLTSINANRGSFRLAEKPAKTTLASW